MILSDLQIKEAIKKGDIVITPLEDSQIGSNSVDLHIGDKLKIFARFTKYDTKEGLLSHIGFEDYLDSKEKPEMVDIEIPETGIVLQPGVLYLAATNEWTETRNLVPQLKGKSSLSRLGLQIDKTASFGDNGFCGNWTMQLSVEMPLKIYPFQKICQIYYTTTGETQNSYDKKADAKYQNSKGAVASEMEKNFVK